MGIKIIKNKELWMEDQALQQLHKLNKLKDVTDIVALPDLHPAKTPVGVTVKTHHLIYPHIIGNDIGCGMCFVNTNIKVKKFNAEACSKSLEGTSITGKYSIGGGNHFLECQVIDKIYSKDAYKKLDLDDKYLYLLIHSGSRGLGDEVYRKFASVEGLEDSTEEFDSYIEAYNDAIVFAKENRRELADIFVSMIGRKVKNEVVLDCVHNYIEVIDGNYYHHKGTISSYENRYAVIAGSRGSYSYIVECISGEDNLYSISHGAGRKIPRYNSKGIIGNKYTRKQLKTTSIGSFVIIDKIDLLYEEAPENYKSIEKVIEALVEHKCIRLVARLKPILNYKC